MTSLPCHQECPISISFGGNFFFQFLLWILWYPKQEGVLHYTMANAKKFEVLLFNRKGNFTMLQSTIQELLVQQGLDAALEEVYQDEGWQVEIYSEESYKYY